MTSPFHSKAMQTAVLVQLVLVRGADIQPSADSNAIDEQEAAPGRSTTTEGE